MLMIHQERQAHNSSLEKRLQELFERNLTLLMVVVMLLNFWVGSEFVETKSFPRVRVYAFLSGIFSAQVPKS